MIRTTRAALSALVPTGALALAVVFASAALAPEAATAPEPSAEPVVAATPVAASAPLDDGGTASGLPLCCGGAEAAGEDPIGGEALAPPATGTPEAVAPEGVVDGGEPAERDPALRDADGVDVGVAIDPPAGPGALALTVADSAAQLQEAEAGPQRREFRGTLPVVTVTDTREAGSGAWYVLASAEDFVSASGRSVIGGDHVGWTPSLVGEPGGAAAGERAASALEGGVGLRDAILLSAWASPVSASATAELRLLTERSVESGSYRSTLTLSLFE